jgi:hypothetical protein
LKDNERRLSEHEVSTSNLSFVEILDQNAGVSNTPINDSPTRVISRLAEIRRNLQVR